MNHDVNRIVNQITILISQVISSARIPAIRRIGQPVCRVVQVSWSKVRRSIASNRCPIWSQSSARPLALLGRAARAHWRRRARSARRSGPRFRTPAPSGHCPRASRKDRTRLDRRDSGLLASRLPDQHRYISATAHCTILASLRPLAAWSLRTRAMISVRLRASATSPRHSAWLNRP